MKIVATALPGVLIVEPTVYADDRGWFMESYHAGKYALAGLDAVFVQDNHSLSHRGVLRGLHYQLDRPQGKLVRVVSGKVFDVAVDLRRSSPTFGKWHGETLSAENRRQLYVPPGFAHGFLALSDAAEVTYKCTELYAPELQRSVRWNDPTIGIDWPITGEPTLAAKDREAELLSDAAPFA